MSRRHRQFKRPSRSIEEAVEHAEAGADRSEHLLSISRLAAFLGRDRGTIAAWIDKGCPVAHRGTTGESTLLDPASVVAWREEMVRTEEASRHVAPTGEDGTPMKPGDLLKLEQLKLTRLKVGQQAEILIPRALAEIAIERGFGLLRQAIMAVPDRIFREMAGYPEEKNQEWYRKAQGQCRAGLKEAAKSVAGLMPSIDEDRLT